MIYGPVPSCLALGSSSGWIASTWEGKRDLDSKLPEAYSERERELALQSQQSLVEPAPRKAAPVDPDGIRGARARLSVRPRGRTEGELVRDIRKANGLDSKPPKTRVADVPGPKPTLTEARIAYRDQRDKELKALGTIGQEQIADAEAMRRASIAAHRAANPVPELPALKAGFRWCQYRRTYVRDFASPYRGS